MCSSRSTFDQGIRSPGCGQRTGGVPKGIQLFFCHVLVVGALVLALCGCTNSPMEPGNGGASSQCISYEQYVHWIGSVDTLPLTPMVALPDGYAYVLEGSLLVLDMTNPLGPEIVNRLDAVGSGPLAVNGSYACVGSMDGLRMLDITDPLDPLLAGWVDLPEQAVGVAISGNRAYVAARYAGLYEVDITDPYNPQIVGSEANAAFNVHVLQGHALTAGSSGINVIDITSSSSIRVVGHLEGEGGVVAVSATHAFVKTAHTLRVMDISDPESPHIIGGLEISDSLSEFVVSGARLYFAQHRKGLGIVNIENPESPHLVGEWRIPGSGWSLAMTGTHAFVAGEGLYHVFEIASGERAPVIGSVEIPYGNKVALSRSYAYVANGRSSLLVIDVGNPQSQELSSSMDFLGQGPTHSVAVSGVLACVGTTTGLNVIDISDPMNLQLAGQVDTPDQAAGVALLDDHAYVAVSDAGLQVIDITVSENPQIVGNVDTPGRASGVAVSSAYAYIADGSTGLQVIDITNPEDLEIVGSVDTPGYATEVAVKGSHAYVADAEFGLQIIDITDPVTPLLVGWVDTPGYATDVAVTGSDAYIADGLGGLHVIDITDPENPQVVGGVPASWTRDASGVAVSGTLVCLVEKHSLHALSVQCSP